MAEEHFTVKEIVIDIQKDVKDIKAQLRASVTWPQFLGVLGLLVTLVVGFVVL